MRTLQLILGILAVFIGFYCLFVSFFVYAFSTTLVDAGLYHAGCIVTLGIGLESLIGGIWLILLVRGNSTPRFTVRWMMIAVAITAVFLVGLRDIWSVATDFINTPRGLELSGILSPGRAVVLLGDYEAPASQGIRPANRYGLMMDSRVVVRRGLRVVTIDPIRRASRRLDRLRRPAPGASIDGEHPGPLRRHQVLPDDP